MLACSVPVPANLAVGRYYLTASYQDRLSRSSAASMNVSYVQVLPVSHPKPPALLAWGTTWTPQQQNLLFY
jgi:hypothetical protein